MNEVVFSAVMFAFVKYSQPKKKHDQDTDTEETKLVNEEVNAAGIWKDRLMLVGCLCN